jgi:hypothetical protein
VTANGQGGVPVGGGVKRIWPVALAGDRPPRADSWLGRGGRCDAGPGCAPGRLTDDAYDADGQLQFVGLRVREVGAVPGQGACRVTAMVRRLQQGQGFSPTR